MNKHIYARFISCFLLVVISTASCLTVLFAQSDSAQRVVTSRPAAPFPFELRDLEITRWEGSKSDSGIAKYPDLAARNRMKNRLWVDVDTLPKGIVRHCTFDQFVVLADSITKAIGLTSSGRKVLNPQQTEELAKAHRMFVSVEGWLVLAYPGGKESTNSYSEEYHDWHLELFDRPLDHYPRIGDPTPIIAEVTPFVERALYRKGVRLENLAAFMRYGSPPNIVEFPVAPKARKIRITGQLLLDDSHTEPGKDVGAFVEKAEKGGYHNPWRRSAWEVHPIYKVEVIEN